MLILAAAVVLVGTPARKDGRKPAAGPVGEWAVHRLEVDGLVVMRAPDGRTGMWITSTSITLAAADLFMEEVAFFEAARGPAELDYNPGDPRELRRAIWKVDGDTLTICEADRGAARPTEFSAPAGSRRVLWVLKRVNQQ